MFLGFISFLKSGSRTCHILSECHVYLSLTHSGLVPGTQYMLNKCGLNKWTHLSTDPSALNIQHLPPWLATSDVSKPLSVLIPAWLPPAIWILQVHSTLWIIIRATFVGALTLFQALPQDVCMYQLFYSPQSPIRQVHLTSSLLEVQGNDAQRRACLRFHS